jgi:hypothetical protein
MIDYATESRILALETSVTNLNQTVRYLQSLVHLQGKATLEAMQAVRDELKKGDERLEQIQSWMAEFDEDTDGWDIAAN